MGILGCLRSLFDLRVKATFRSKQYISALTEMPVYRGRAAAATKFASMLRRASSSLNVTSPWSVKLEHGKRKYSFHEVPEEE